MVKNNRVRTKNNLRPYKSIIKKRVNYLYLKVFSYIMITMEKKGEVEIRTFVGLVIIMIGVLSVSFMGLGFIFNNSTLVWVGTVVLGIISLTSAILEKVLLK